MPARNAGLIAMVDEDHSELSRRITHAFRRLIIILPFFFTISTASS
jgi:hypothetical protein